MALPPSAAPGNTVDEQHSAINRESVGATACQAASNHCTHALVFGGHDAEWTVAPYKWPHGSTTHQGAPRRNNCTGQETRDLSSEAHSASHWLFWQGWVQFQCTILPHLAALMQQLSKVKSMTCWHACAFVLSCPQLHLWDPCLLVLGRTRALTSQLLPAGSSSVPPSSAPSSCPVSASGEQMHPLTSMPLALYSQPGSSSTPPAEPAAQPRRRSWWGWGSSPSAAPAPPSSAQSPSALSLQRQQSTIPMAAPSPGAQLPAHQQGVAEAQAAAGK